MKNRNAAFTLVELAIVMTIIGLLIGGILKGQELLENARVTSTIAQVKGYEAATTGFRDIYGGLPGDLPNAGKLIPGCNDNCTPFADGSANNAGNGHVSGSWYLEESGSVYAMTNPPSHFQHEMQLFWVHLLKANLVSGVTDAAINGGTRFAWGETFPAAKTGGGFVVAFQEPSASSLVPGWPVSDFPVTFGGNILVLQQMAAPIDGGASGSTIDSTPGSLPLTPARAAQIDRKMDDGSADSGDVFGYGVSESCFNPQGNNRFSYNEAVTSKDCGLAFMFQR